MHRRLLAVALVGSIVAAPPAFAQMKGQPAKSTDSIQVKPGGLVEIHSPTHVGSGQLIRTGKTWPAPITVVLVDFGEVEHFRARAGGGNFVCALERPGGVTSTRVCRLGDKVVGGAQVQGRNLRVKLPADLVRRNDEAIVLEWVDQWR